MIEQANIKIGGEEYSFLKPLAKDLIMVEDNSIGEDFKMDEFKYLTGLLNLVSPKIDINDLVKKNINPVKLSSGEEITPNDITYKQYNGIVKTIPNIRSRNEVAKAFLALCGVEGDISLDNFTYNDINDLAIAFKDVFDTSELDEVMAKIVNFCLS